MAAQDALTDLAILGPVSTTATALPLADGEDLPIGTETYLIGYPAETEAFPQPTITRGLISRVREWETAGITYFQTDATVASGQSGGALVNDNGDVIGISGLVNNDGNFAIVASAADIAPRVDDLMFDTNETEHDRRIQFHRGRYRVEDTLRTYWSQGVYVINEPAGTNVDFELNSNADGGLSIRNIYGIESLSIDKSVRQSGSGSFVVQYSLPYFVIARVESEVATDFSLTSNHRLIPMEDPDDGAVLDPHAPYHGNIDFPGDTDYLHVNLRQGERVSIGASSTLLDMHLVMDFIGAEDHEAVFDDNGGSGFFGTDAKIVFEAPFTGSYFVAVQDIHGDAPGGYVLSLESAALYEPLTLTTWAKKSNDAGSRFYFGTKELTSGLSSLPDSFVQVNPSDLDVSIETMGLADYFSDLVVFVSEDPLAFVMAATGPLSDVEKALFDLSMSGSSYEEFIGGLIYGLESGSEIFEIHDSEPLPPTSIGDSSFGAAVDFTSDGVRVVVEMILFRRNDVGAIVYTYREPGRQAAIQVREAALLIDEEIIAHSKIR